jgi:hypothetical protein
MLPDTIRTDSAQFWLQERFQSFLRSNGIEHHVVPEGLSYSVNKAESELAAYIRERDERLGLKGAAHA